MTWVQHVVSFLGFVVLTVVVLHVRARRAERRQDAVASGDAVRCRAVLHPAGGPSARGELEVSPGRAVWWPSGPGDGLHLTTARALSVGAGRRRRSRQDDVELRLRLVDGREVGLVLHELDAELLGALLDDVAVSPALADPPPVVARARGRRCGRPSWPVVLLGLAVVWCSGCSLLFVAGRTVDAEVLGTDGDGVCEVTWVGRHGERRQAEVDCGDERAGDDVRVWELAPPLDFEALDTVVTPWVVGSVAAVLAAAGGIGLASRSRRLRRGRPVVDGVSAVAAAAEHVDLPRLDRVTAAQQDGEGPVGYLQRLVPYARRHAPWTALTDPRRPGGAGLRPQLPRLATAFRFHVAALLVVLALGGFAVHDWVLLGSGPVREETAVSTGEGTSRFPGPIPDVVQVTYVLGSGREHTVEVYTDQDLPEGTAVPVVASVDRPGVARIDGPADGLPAAVTLTVTALLAVGIVAAGRARRMVLDQRETREAAAGPDRRAVGLVTTDVDGRAVLVLRALADHPAGLLGVPLRRPVPVAFSEAAEPLDLVVSGRFGAGGLLVAALAGAPTALLVAAGPAQELVPFDVVALVDPVALLGWDLDDDPPTSDR